MTGPPVLEVRRLTKLFDQVVAARDIDVSIATEEKFAVMDIVVAALAQRKATVVFIEHDIDIVERYGTRVVAFHEGRILADGPAAGVLGDSRVREHVTGRRRA